LLDATCIYFDNILDRYAQRFSIWHHNEYL
jgi:hypothetical protein